jgi:hypothetical protein
MPADRQVGGLVHLLESLLDFVLAKIDLTAIGDSPDVIDAEGFRDSDESNGSGVAPGPVGRPRNSIANIGQPGAERGGIGHAPEASI